MSSTAARAVLVDTLLECTLLGGSVLVVALAALLDVRNDVQVVVPWLQQPLPEICLMRRLFGVACPGCGLTRSFISLAHGQWLDALNYHPAGPLLFVVVVLQIPLRMWRLWQIRTSGRLLAISDGTLLLGVALVAILATGVVRVFH